MPSFLTETVPKNVPGKTVAGDRLPPISGHPFAACAPVFFYRANMRRAYFPATACLFSAASKGFTASGVVALPSKMSVGVIVGSP